MNLTTKQKQYLKGIAHNLKPVVMLGQHGLTEGVLAEIDAALAHHELIKVKVGGADREDRDAMIDHLAARAEAALVQRIGHIAVLYRPSKDKRHIVLPRA